MNMADKVKNISEKLNSMEVDPVRIFVAANTDHIRGYQALKDGAEEHADNQELVSEIRSLREKIDKARLKERRAGYFSKNPPSSLLEFRLSNLQKTLYGDLDAKHSNLLEAVTDLRRLLKDLDVDVSTRDLWKLMDMRMEENEALMMTKALKGKETKDLGKLIDSFLLKYGEDYLNEMTTFVRSLIMMGVEYPPDIVDIIVERYESKQGSDTPP